MIPSRTVSSALFCLATAFVFVSCGPRGAQQPDVFTVMTYNLDGYCLDDRDGDGQSDDPKPTEEREAVTAIIAAVSPDILAIQEIGSRSVLEGFEAALALQGLEYPYVRTASGGTTEYRVAILSRLPIVASRSHLDEYTIGEHALHVPGGIMEVDIQVNSNRTIRLFTADLTPKHFHPAGQTEMRRNEARLLANHLRESSKECADELILFAGSLNDSPMSAPVREVTAADQAKGLRDLRPTDADGDAWTYFDSEEDTYLRSDYLLASAELTPFVVRDQTRVIDLPGTGLASDHRPLVAAFRFPHSASRARTGGSD